MVVSHAWKVRGAVVGMCMVLGAGCQQRTPTAQASQPGKPPSWGQGFGTQQPSAPTGLQPAAPLAAPVAGELAARGLPMAPMGGGGGGMPSDAVHGGAGGEQRAQPAGRIGNSGTDWGGGDVELGRRTFGNMCARCHGMNGKGGLNNEAGKVPDLTTAEFQDRMGDAQIASQVAHGKGKMPSFMDKMNGEALRGVVAYIRSLRQ
ncbi:MAG: cytochrome c [Deltaproteobacteria bacterium]|nr:cytochrome c [Deltaproteobacteria bacterium]